MTDRELAERCLKGDQSAQELLWKRFSGVMYAVCRRYFARDEDAQDALQEGIIRVFRYLDSWKGDGPLGAWIRRIMVNTSLNMLKSNAGKVSHISTDSLTDLSSAEMDVLGKLNEDDLVQLIQRMPEGYRTVFNLFAIEGYAHQEIASMLDISESTSKTQYHKAKGWLKSRINGLPEDHTTNG
jgi:RNA polymerase sigma-70 factor (ECF subfamily)